MSMNVALTGLKAATSDLSVVSNNIANANTTGFKSSRAEFGDMVGNNTAVNVSRSQTGMGVRLQEVNQQFEQGSLNSTNNELDLAINGKGFFQVSDSGGNYYTRAGSFHVDKDGFIVNNASQKLMGYGLDNNNNLTSSMGNVGINTNLKLDIDPTATPPTAINVPVQFVEPKATTDGALGLNLKNSALEPAAITAGGTFDPIDSGTYNYTTSMTIYDSEGGSHSLQLFFTTDAVVGTPGTGWNVVATLDGDPDPANAITPSGNIPVPLVFTSDGKLDVSSLTPEDRPELYFDLSGVTLSSGATLGEGASGINPGQVTLDISTFTQFSGNYSVDKMTQNGYPKGDLQELDIAEDGTIYGLYSNGKSLAVGQVVLANFMNVQGLQPVGDTAWAATVESGNPQLGTPGVNGTGKLISGALEVSNVDLTEQLVNMIVAQRNFQANAQVITTNNTLSQTILNIR